MVSSAPPAHSTALGTTPSSVGRLGSRSSNLARQTRLLLQLAARSRRLWYVAFPPSFRPCVDRDRAVVSPGFNANVCVLDGRAAKPNALLARARLVAFVEFSQESTRVAPIVVFGAVVCCWLTATLCAQQPERETHSPRARCCCLGREKAARATRARRPRARKWPACYRWRRLRAPRADRNCARPTNTQ